MRITIVAGADAADFVRALATALGPGDDLDVVAPVVRDHWSAGLKACPDLDALLRDPGRPTTQEVARGLEDLGYVPGWQRSDDREMAHRLVRTELLAAGYSLTEATAAAATRAGLPYRLLPMCDERAEMRVVVQREPPYAVHVGQYLADPASYLPTELLLVSEGLAPSDAVSAALSAADAVVLGPSSRTLVIDPVLRVPGLLAQLAHDLPVLVVEHDDTAPHDLVAAAGLPAPDPGRASRVPADVDAVVDRLRATVTS